VILSKAATVEQVNAAFREAAAGPLKGILGVSDEPLVSADYLHEPQSTVVDLLSTMAVGERFMKVLAWYDNEWGYSCRVVDLVDYVAKRL
jgi:glyceraldehyde 3-phosphate dehydrogenase